MGDSIRAYDLAERVRRYDADMDVMHPLRWKMIEIALDILPFDSDTPLEVLDLGVGTGVFTQQLLARYPRAQVTAVDGAPAMIDMARVRLGAAAERVRFVTADFCELPAALLTPPRYHAVISSYALHHLDAQEKRGVLETVIAALQPGGWLLNADICIARSPLVEQRFQALRVAGIVERAAPDDARYADAATTRASLDAMEAEEGDQPRPATADLALMLACGLPRAEIIWKEYREAVIGGPR